MKTMNNMTTSTTSPEGKRMLTNFKGASRLTRLSALAATVMVAASCSLLPATDLDRVQPNYTSKDIFQGEWYARALVVDKQYTNAWMFEGLEGNLERIRWEITRDSLRAYRSYEGVPGEEAEDIGEQTLVAEFAIESHFDIRRAYNPTNGVETNVIEENTFDRPWWERDYIRLNWSQNTAPYMPLFGIELADLFNNQGGATINRSNADADPTEPFRVRVSNDYIETTVDVIMQPDIYSCWDLGVELYASELTLTEVSLEGAAATEAGGGLYLSTGSQATGEGCSFTGCAPEDLYVEGVGGFSAADAFSCDGEGCRGAAARAAADYVGRHVDAPPPARLRQWRSPGSRRGPSRHRGPGAQRRARG